MDDLKTEMDTDLTEGLIERINEAKRETDKRIQRNPHSQLSDFMASSARMLDLQRKFINDEETAYQIERIKLLDSYRVQLENLKFEAATAVRELDQKHYARTSDARKLMERLVTMRDMPL